MPATTVISNAQEIRRRFLYRYSVWKTLFAWEAQQITDEEAALSMCVTVSDAHWIRSVAMDSVKAEKLTQMF